MGEPGPGGPMGPPPGDPGPDGPGTRSIIWDQGLQGDHLREICLHLIQMGPPPGRDMGDPGGPPPGDMGPPPPGPWTRYGWKWIHTWMMPPSSRTMGPEGPMPPPPEGDMGPADMPPPPPDDPADDIRSVIFNRTN